MSEADRAFAACWWIVDDLVRFGLEHACVSPGARSTPIALALRRHPSVKVHVHLDERASAFFALGVAKGSSRPVAVACTSGTAAAELLPAVVEASMSRAKLFLLTADRPPELRGVGANQTIDQPGLYGPYVHASLDAPVPGDAPGAETWHELAIEATRAAMGPPPGPVHLNLPFREPLVPANISLPASPSSDADPTISEGPEPQEVEELVLELASTPRGVVLAGSLREPPPGVPELAARAGWPLIAEPISGVRGAGALGAGQFLLENAGFASAHVPDVVLQVGAAPTSRPTLELVRRAGRLLTLDQDHLVADPLRKAGLAITAEEAAVVPRVLERLPPVAESSWLRAWLDADRAARAAVDDRLDGLDEPFEGRIARDVAANAPDGTALVVGSSMPVRDLDAYMFPRDGLRVLANRGASGIDGFVSTVLGVATSGTRATALCGDLTLLHDVGSLLWSARRGYDALFVIPNNGGGVIFRFLEQRELPELEELFTTPHDLDLGAVCSAAGAGHSRVERARDLLPALERGRAAGGVHVVEVVVDPALNVRRHAEVHESVAEALRSNP